MKKLIPIMIFLLASLHCDAQNWNPLTPGVTRYFTNSYGYMKGMRIDSLIAFGSDLHYFPFKTKRAHKDDGIYPWDTANVRGSWLGSVIIKKPDGSVRIPNYWSDTILIKPQAQVGDSWTFYHDSSTVYYVAHIAAADTVTISGSVDSIKSIVLSVYNNGIPVPADSLDGLEIIISKAHGFYQVPELYMFPFHAPGAINPVPDYFFHNSVMPLDMYVFGWTPGWPNAENTLFRLVDQQPKTAAEINDLNLGDVFEYSSCTDWCTGGPYYYQLDTIISKVADVNGVYYGMRGWLATRNGNYFMLEPHTDTVFFSALTNVQMYEAYDPVSTSNGRLYHYLPSDTSFCLTSGLHYSYSYYAGLPGLSGYTVYKDGIGLIKSYSIAAPDENERELLYFVKNGVPCGNFYMPDTSAPVVNHITNINETPPISIYPNPASEQLTIETTLSHYDLTLINAIGQTVYRRSNCDSKQLLDVSDLINGVYQLRIENTGQAVMNKKIVVRH